MRYTFIVVILSFFTACGPAPENTTSNGATPAENAVSATKTALRSATTFSREAEAAIAFFNAKTAGSAVNVNETRKLINSHKASLDSTVVTVESAYRTVRAARSQAETATNTEERKAAEKEAEQAKNQALSARDKAQQALQNIISLTGYSN